MTTQNIPNSFRFHRQKAGLRQIDVAAKLGLTSYARISHWEHGTAFPSVRNLFRLAALYGTMPHELYSEMWNTITVPTDLQDE